MELICLPKKSCLRQIKSVNEICDYIGAKSLKFLSIDGLYKAMGYEKEIILILNLPIIISLGDYPVEIIDELGENKLPNSHC